ncbi:MAG: hypothetical protein ABI216_03495, partial [Devosia sp.]
LQSLSMQIQDHHQISKLLHRGSTSDKEIHARYLGAVSSPASALDSSQQEEVGNIQTPLVG